MRVCVCICVCARLHVTYAWQGLLLVQCILGFQGRLSGTVGEEGTAWNSEGEKTEIITFAWTGDRQERGAAPITSK